jgi:dUTP pyrophosphatase
MKGLILIKNICCQSTKTYGVKMVENPFQEELQKDFVEGNEIIIETLAEQEANLPQYISEGAAGADVRAYLKEPAVILPGCAMLIPTGLKMAIPEGYEVQVRSRSGLAFKHQVVVLNSPGTIDSDYRGELKVLLMNHGREPFVVEPGMRIAQVVSARVAKAVFIRTSELTSTKRNEGGFGHTGVQ